MTISLACPACGVKLRIPDSFAGKKVKCPKCGQRLGSSSAEMAALPADAGDRLLTTLDGATGPLALAPDGDLLATVAPRTVALWEAQTGFPVEDLKVPHSFNTAVAFSLDSKRLACGDSEGYLHVWEMDHRKLLWMRVLDGPIRNLAFSPDAETLACGLKRPDKATPGKQEVLLLRVNNGNIVGQFDDQVDCLVYATDGEGLVTSGADRRVRFWKLEETGIWPLKKWQAQQVRELKHKNRVLALALSGDGELLANGGGDAALPQDGDHAVRIWNLETIRLVFTRTEYEGIVRALAFFPDCRRLAVGGTRGLLVQDIETGEIKASLSSANVGHVGISADGRLVAAAGTSDKGAPAVWVWKLARPDR